MKHSAVCAQAEEIQMVFPSRDHGRRTGKDASQMLPSAGRGPPDPIPGFVIHRAIRAHPEEIQAVRPPRGHRKAKSILNNRRRLITAGEPGDPAGGGVRQGRIFLELHCAVSDRLCVVESVLAVGILAWCHPYRRIVRVVGILVCLRGSRSADAKFMRCAVALWGVAYEEITDAHTMALVADIIGDFYLVGLP